MQFQPKKILYLRFMLLALFISACALYYSYPNIQKKVSNSIILKRSCLKKKITDISTFLQDRSENFNLQNEDCNIISSTMDQIFDLGENLGLFSSSQNLSLWVLISTGPDYGNTGCRVFKGGIQNYKDSCQKINIPKGNYWILKVGIEASCKNWASFYK